MGLCLLAGSSATIAAALGELLDPPPHTHIGLLLYVGGRNMFVSAAE